MELLNYKIMDSFIQKVILIFMKDLKTEIREKLNVVYLFILCPTLSLIMFIFLGEKSMVELFFLTCLIVALVANQRISRQEISVGGELILISAPIDLSILCFSKILFFIFINVFINIIVFITLFMLSNNFILIDFIGFSFLCLLFTIGLSSILCTFSLMLERIKGEGQFMFILIYPLIVPFLVLSYNSINLLGLLPSEEFFSSFALQGLAAFDILLLTICPILFSYSIRR